MAKTKSKSKNSDFLLGTNLSRVFNPVALIISVGWTIGLFVTFWNESFYKSVNMLERWSFTKIDTPWTPPPTLPIPLWHGHYFGDFQLPVLYSKVLNPYRPEWPIDAGLPGPILLLKIFLVFPMNYSLILFFVISLAVLLYGLWSLLQINHPYVVSLLVVIGILNLPFFIAVDRGNFVIISLGLLFAVIGKLMRSSKLELSRFDLAVFGGLFAIAASLKLYYLAFLPFFWLMNHKKFAYTAFLQFLIFNFVSFFLVVSNLREAFSSIVQSLLYQTGSNDPMWILGGIGLPSLPSNLLFMWLPRSEFDQHLLGYRYLFLSLCLLWFLIVVWLFRFTSLDKDYKLIWVLSLAQFAAPTAMAYTGLWATGALVLLIKVLCEKKQLERIDLFQWYLLFIPIVVNLSPNAWTYWRQLIPSIWILSIIGQLILLRNIGRLNRV